MKDTNPNKNAKRSIRLIKQSFARILKERDFEKITVTSIVEKADITRATFYAHFYDVRDVLEEIENDIISQLKAILNGIEKLEVVKNPLPYLKKINQFLNEDLEYYSLLASVKTSTIFIDNLKEIFMNEFLSNKAFEKLVKDEEKFKISLHFCASGLASVYIDFLQGKLNISLEQVADVLADLIINAGKQIIVFSI